MLEIPWMSFFIKNSFFIQNQDRRVQDNSLRDLRSLNSYILNIIYSFIYFSFIFSVYFSYRHKCCSDFSSYVCVLNENALQCFYLFFFLLTYSHITHAYTHMYRSGEAAKRLMEKKFLKSIVRNLSRLMAGSSSANAQKRIRKTLAFELRCDLYEICLVWLKSWYCEEQCTILRWTCLFFALFGRVLGSSTTMETTLIWDTSNSCYGSCAS